jgi:hypothetical protein
MIKSIEHQGMLVRDCTIEGEQRADDVWPAHPNGIQVSKDTWLIVYATRGFRGGDDDRSSIYQLRKDTPDGPIIKEGELALTNEEWDPLNDGSRYIKQCGHPVAFGIPKGALIHGKKAVNENVFVIKWRTTPRVFDKEKDFLPWDAGFPEYGRVEWLQCRLNKAEDDIDILQEPCEMQQKGYEQEETFCMHEHVKVMNQSFAHCIPYNEDATEWIGMHHFDYTDNADKGSVAGARFTFNRQTGLYEWTDIGPFLGAEDKVLFEASVVPYNDEWLICARVGWGEFQLAWFRTDDPFNDSPQAVLTDSIKNDGPFTMSVCADGIIRIFGGDKTVSPYEMARCPLYCWDINPENKYTAENRKVLFDVIESGLPFPKENLPVTDMCKLLPHAGGHEQYALYRVRSQSINVEKKHPAGFIIPSATQEEKDASGIYYAKITYDAEYPAAWVFR